MISISTYITRTTNTPVTLRQKYPVTYWASSIPRQKYSGHKTGNTNSSDPLLLTSIFIVEYWSSSCSECTLYTENNVIWYHDVAISWFNDDSLMMIVYSVQCMVAA